MTSVNDTIVSSIKTLTGSLSEYPNHYLTSDPREGHHLKKSKNSMLKAVDYLNRTQMCASQERERSGIISSTAVEKDRCYRWGYKAPVSAAY